MLISQIMERLIIKQAATEQAMRLPQYSVDHAAIAALWIGPDGRLWLSCHGIVRGQDPYLVIDPIDFDSAGVIHATGPTYTPQAIPIPRKRTLGLF